MDTKCCSICGKYKDLNEFHVANLHKDGRASRCKVCSSIYIKNYYQSHRDERIEYSKEWEKDNPERSNIRKRAWEKRNKEKVYEIHNQWRRTDNGRRCRLMSENRRRARKTGLPATLTTEEWLLTLELFGKACAYCGSTDDIQQDHFVPVTLGGPYEFGNIVPACPKCNISKHNHPPEEWCNPAVYDSVTTTLRK